MWHPVHLGQAAASLVPCVIRARTCGQSGAIPVIDGHLWGARKAAYAALMPLTCMSTTPAGGFR